MNAGNGTERQIIQVPPVIRRFVYPVAQMQVGPLHELLPDMAGIEIEGEIPTVVALTAMDGSGTHCFLFTEHGKREFVRQLTGGIEIAKPGDVP